MLQRVARLLVVLIALVALALVAVWVVTNTDYRPGAGAAIRARRAVQVDARHREAGRRHGDLLNGATIAGISITDSAGRPFLEGGFADRLATCSATCSEAHRDLDDLVLYRPDS